MNTQIQRIYYRNLDLVRFLAAYMIVVFHAYFGWKANFGYPESFTDEDGKLHQLGKLLENGLHNFSFGVEIFFLLSGFLITTLLLREKSRSGKIDNRSFYIRRALRIWPLYYLTLALGPILTWMFQEKGCDYMYHIFFTGNFELIRNGFSNVAANHLWSICVEEHFYLIAPLLIGLLPVRKLPQVLLGMILISFTYRLMVAGTENYWMKIYMNTFSRMDTLCIGALGAWFMHYRKIKFNHSLPVRLMIYSIFIVLFFMDDMSNYDQIFLAGARKYFYIAFAAYWLGNLLFNRSAVGAPKKLNYFHHLGRMSYAIYMLNPIMVALGIKYFQSMGWSSFAWFMIVVHVLVLTACNLSYYIIEQPFLKLKERYTVVKSGGKLKNLLDTPIFGPFSPEENQELVLSPSKVKHKS